MSVFHFGAGSTSASATVKGYFDTLKSFIPNGVTITVPNTGDTINEATGEIDGVWTASGGGTVTSTGGAGAWVAGVGMRSVWVTGGITRGRRVRGSTFVVPLIAAAYDTDGTLTSGAQSALTTANTFMGVDATFGVYTRPSPAASNGAFHVALAELAPDRVSWLRSRRT